MDINIFLMTHRSYFPNRIDLMNNIKEKASSLSEDEKTKVTQTLAMYKFYNPALMTFLAIPLIIIGCVIFAKDLHYVLFSLLFSFSYRGYRYHLSQICISLYSD